MKISGTKASRWYMRGKRAVQTVVVLSACGIAWYAYNMRASALSLRDELARYRAANESAVAVMRSIRGRAAEARELKQWFDALVTLDGMATLARVFPDSRILLDDFTVEYEKTIAAAKAARKARDHESGTDGGSDSGADAGEERHRIPA